MKYFIDELKPSHLKDIHPWESIFQKTELESMARAIMHYLSETGDTFRPLTYSEFTAKYTGWDEYVFTKVAPHCDDPIMAMQFSRSWGRVVKPGFSFRK